MDKNCFYTALIKLPVKYHIIIYIETLYYPYRDYVIYIEAPALIIIYVRKNRVLVKQTSCIY